MKLKQVLVIYKQVSSSDIFVQKKNALHLATLNELYELLKDMGISFEAQSTKQLRKIHNVDLVITVGGDGTVLWTSHFVDKIPILGVKSFGRHSVGYFCAATRQTMKDYLQDIIRGHKCTVELHRLEVAINGQKMTERVLNEVLFSNATPASTSRYKLLVGNKSEDHKSSGVWVSTAAGSTAAIKAAGGKVLPLTSNKMEYLVREPYFTGRRYRLTNGVLSPRATVKFVSAMREGTVFIDGGSSQYPAPIGAVVTVKGARHPLKVYWK